MDYTISDRSSAYWFLSQLRNRGQKELSQLIHGIPRLRAENNVRRAKAGIQVMQNVIKNMWVLEREEEEKKVA